MEVFKFNNDSFKEDHELFHQISDDIEVCCHAALKILSAWMSYVEGHIYITKTANHELDKYVDSGMMAGLNDDDKFTRCKDHG